MGYKALYRSYRPQRFSDVAGQEHITRTFSNALKNDKIAHAYLFAGPRGTGKTTIAKLVAKAVNCLDFIDGEPCNKCAVCQGINDGSLSDVVEIDAASNNGVDEIREIRDKVKYLPGVGKYKVYIIDEVHMLSTGAFNALLKTLEEPPKHVIFILATTEPYKVPGTILSRCQRFDFRNISIKDIVARLKEICISESIDIDDDAIEMIAANAEGGMRDALSLLDQTISYTSEKIKADDVHTISGSVSSAMLLSLVKTIIGKNVAEALQVLDKLIDEGKDISRIVSDMVQFCRDLLVYKSTKKQTEQKRLFDNAEFQELSQDVSNQHLYAILRLLNETQNNIKWTNQKRAFVELALIKMTDDVEMASVIVEERLCELEKQVRELSTHKDSVKQSISPTEHNNDNGLSKIMIIEEILNSGDKGKKVSLQRGWDSLRMIDDPKMINVARTLSRAQIGAVNDDKMILTYPDRVSCNLMVKEESKRIVREILNRKTKIIDDYVVITDNEWKDITKEYIAQQKVGIKYPKLGKINIEPDMQEIVSKNKNRKSTSELAAEFFGKEKIKITEED